HSGEGRRRGPALELQGHPGRCTASDRGPAGRSGACFRTESVPGRDHRLQSRPISPAPSDRPAPRRAEVCPLTWLPQAPVRLAAGPVLEGDVEILEALTNLIAQCEVLLLAGLVAQVNEDLHQPPDELVVPASFRRGRLAEQAEDLAQFAQHK